MPAVHYANTHSVLRDTRTLLYACLHGPKGQLADRLQGSGSQAYAALRLVREDAHRNMLTTPSCLAG